MSDKKSGHMTDVFAGGIIGGFIGSIIGVLYAPKSGKEMRDELVKKAGEFLVTAKEEYEQIFEHIIKEKAEEAEEKVTELKEFSKQVVKKQTGRIKKALAAGFEAYREEQERK
jgi:gas vesicle protein